MSRVSIIPRLLTRDEAADYVGFSRAAFERHCSVVPIRFGDERLIRWDRYDLDAWIETRKAPPKAADAILTEDEMRRAMMEFEG